ncbi:60S ribosomal protein L15 (Fragment) [Lemmus lemmus]
MPGSYCGVLRVLNSELVKSPHIIYLRLSYLIHSIKPSGEILTLSGSPNRSTSTERHVIDIYGHKSCRLGKGHKFHHTISGSQCADWRRHHNVLQLLHYCALI